MNISYPIQAWQPTAALMEPSVASDEHASMVHARMPNCLTLLVYTYICESEGW